MWDGLLGGGGGGCLANIGDFRFYSREIIDHVHRARALEEWSKLISGDQVSLERGLGAFDMFVLHDEHGDLAEVS